MEAVHANFHGTKGNIARFGDSITYSGAFFKPLQWDFTNRSSSDAAAQDWLQSYISPSCWSWQDDAVAYSNGNYSGTMSSWPLSVEQGPPGNNINFWLNKLKPELAVVMWGTNDLGPYDVTTYTNNMRQVLQACKTYGTIPLLTTIPPRRGSDAKSAQFAQAMRDLAVEQQVPMIDYNQEILTRRPGGTWDGTLISSDGIHPSWDGATAQDFAQTSLNSNGYLLRNWVTLHGLYDVYQNVLSDDPPPLRPQVTVRDVSSADVAGSGPLRRFPVPAAANWPGGARCIYDNYATGLAFSPDNNPGNYNLVSLPLANADITINGVQNNVNAPTVDNGFSLYTNPEGSDADARADRRFPYHIPRLARSHAANYLAVEFNLSQPSEYFGVFLPASSNSYGSQPGQYFDDQNFMAQDRSVWVIVEDEGDAPGQGESQYVSLGGGYCPFLSIQWDGVYRIRKVTVIHDVSETCDRGVGFMDVYIVPEPASLVLLLSAGAGLLLRRRR
jgi:hypothetical protein